MASQGPRSAGTGANSTTTGSAWGSPGNIVSSNNSRATATLLEDGFSQYLHATNFGFSIPLTATIDGIVFEPERSAATGFFVQDYEVFVIKGGTRGTTNRSAGATWPGSDAYATFGSPTDLWGLSWTPADINASNFGFAVRCRNIDGGNQWSVGVDHVRATIYYTETATPAELSATANGTSSTTIALRSRHKFSATANGASSATLKVRSRHLLSSTANAAASMSVEVVAPARLAATVSAASSAAAEVITRTQFAVEVVASSSMDVAVRSAALLSPIANAAGGLDLTLRSRALLTATAHGALTATITVATPRALSATVTGTAGMSVTLRGRAPLVAAVVATSSVTIDLLARRIAEHGYGRLGVRRSAAGVLQITTAATGQLAIVASATGILRIFGPGADSMNDDGQQHGLRLDVNDAPRIEYEVYDDDGELVDPSTIDLRARDPRGSISNYAGTAWEHIDTGRYALVMAPVTVPDEWFVRVETTVPRTAEEGSFVVKQNRVDRIN